LQETSKADTSKSSGSHELLNNVISLVLTIARLLPQPNHKKNTCRKDAQKSQKELNALRSLLRLMRLFAAKFVS